jgi:hypothetical protein
LNEGVLAGGQAGRAVFPHGLAACSPINPKTEVQTTKNAKFSEMINLEKELKPQMDIDFKRVARNSKLTLRVRPQICITL